MRIDTPGDNWIELRGVDELTGADDDAWQAVYAAVWAERAEQAVNDDDDDGMEMSGDGVSMVPKKRNVKVPPDIIRRQRDALLTELISNWSYTAPDAKPYIPLPYTTASRKLLPLPACKILEETIRPHIQAITGSGPKGKTSATSTSGSEDESPNSPQGSTGEPPITASPSSATT
jgi:hypothetical protein